LLCANDHRIVTDDQKDHPAGVDGCDQFLLSVGNFLLGLADMLAIIIHRLYEYGEALIVRANAAALATGGRVSMFSRFGRAADLAAGLCRKRRQRPEETASLQQATDTRRLGMVIGLRHRDEDRRWTGAQSWLLPHLLWR
jgi:hypothetical protein